MGHWCKICDRVLSNEKFPGKGRRNHICKKCSVLPVEQISAIQQEDELFDYLHQSHISSKNLTRLKSLASSSNQKISRLAGIVLDVARVKPYKRRRLKFLAARHPDLLKKLEETGLVYAHHDAGMEEFDFDEE